MAKKYSEIFKEMYKGCANDAAAFSCEMEYYISCSKYDMADFCKTKVDMSLEHALQLKKQYLKWKKIEERA